MKNDCINSVLELTTIAIAVVVTLLAWTVLTVPPAHAEAIQSRQTSIVWLWSATSPAVNRSTEALATGHAVRAVRLAKTAALTARQDADRLIAVHNLCLALLAGRAATDAGPHCHTALRTPESFKVIRERGALLVMSDSAPARGGETLSLVAVMRANITRAYAIASFNNMAAADAVPRRGMIMISHND